MSGRHIHRFLLPSTETIDPGIRKVMGVCKCGFQKEHEPFWGGGTKEYANSPSFRMYPDGLKRLQLERMGFQLV